MEAGESPAARTARRAEMTAISMNSTGRHQTLSHLRHLHRAMHLIDIENLTGSPLPSLADAAHVRAVYRKHVGVGPGDHVVVACSHLAFKNAGFGWSDARHLVRSGPDGADSELLDVLYLENVAARFHRIVIGSGDGIFAAAAAYLASRGCHVAVVSRRERLSARLRLAAHDVIYLDSETPSTGAMASGRVA
jgi:NYN domain